MLPPGLVASRDMMQRNRLRLEVKLASMAAEIFYCTV